MTTSLKGKTVLVTGAGGFIGSHLTERLVELGAETRAFVRYTSTGSRGWLGASPHAGNIRFIHGDIRDHSLIEKAVQGCDVVFHLAALIGIPYSYDAPDSYVQTNVTGTLNVLQSCRANSVGRLINTSTSEVYGTALYTPIDEKHPLQGQSPYSATKIGADKLVESFWRSFELDAVTARPFNTFGPRQSARAVIPTIISQLLAGAKKIRLGNLEARRDLNYVANTVDAFIACGVAPGIGGQTIHFGSGREVSIGELFTIIRDLTGSDAEVEVDAARIRPEKSEVGLLLADNTNAHNLLGWSPKVTLEEGLGEVVAWVKENLHAFRTEEYAVQEISGERTHPACWIRHPAEPRFQNISVMTEPTSIPLCEPSLSGREREYVDDVLRSGWVSSAGPFVNKFEAAFAERLGTPEAVAVASGTAALHLALLACGVRPEDEVLVSAMTFIAPANAVRYIGAWPVFIDADPATWQMDVALVRAFLENECRRTPEGPVNRSTGRRVSAILPVHILGHPVDMDALLEVAAQFDLQVIEDATESLGAFCRGRAAGTIGRVGCFSFNGNKLITSGGGGMIVSNDPQVLKTVRHLSTQAKLPGNEYIHDEIGFNYRLTNLQAALGFAQFEQVDDFLAKKRVVADAYRRDLAGIPGLEFQEEADWARSAWWLFTIQADGSRDLIKALGEDGIQSRPLWQPMHRSAPHAESFALPCPVADRLFERGISLPSSVSLSAGDQRRVCETLRARAAAPTIS